MSAALLLLRLAMGIIIMHHGFDKIIFFNSKENTGLNFMGIGNALSQVLIILVELGGIFLIVIGLCTRAASIILTGWLIFVLIKSFDAAIFGSG